jgi:hypothetical protein
MGLTNGTPFCEMHMAETFFLALKHGEEIQAAKETTYTAFGLTAEEFQNALDRLTPNELAKAQLAVGYEPEDAATVPVHYLTNDGEICTAYFPPSELGDMVSVAGTLETDMDAKHVWPLGEPKFPAEENSAREENSSAGEKPTAQEGGTRQPSKAEVVQYFRTYRLDIETEWNRQEHKEPTTAAEFILQESEFCSCMSYFMSVLHHGIDESCGAWKPGSEWAYCMAHIALSDRPEAKTAVKEMFYGWDEDSLYTPWQDSKHWDICAECLVYTLGKVKQLSS